jgi:hypothetical protein
LNRGIDPEVLGGTEICGFYIEAGVSKFADVARAVANDLDAEVSGFLNTSGRWYNGGRHLGVFRLDVAGVDSPETVAPRRHCRRT